MKKGQKKPELYQGCLRKMKYKTYHAAEIGAKEKGESIIVNIKFIGVNIVIAFI